MRKKLVILGCFVVFGVVAFTACHSTMLGLERVDMNVADKPAAYPPLDGYTKDDWLTARGQIKQEFEDQIYGPWPGSMAVEVTSKRMINPQFHGGILEEWTLLLGENDAQRRIHMAVALPSFASSTAPVPFILSLSFGSNCAVFPGEPLTGPQMVACDTDPKTGFGERMVQRIFGEYIARVPIKDYFSAGLGYANVYASEFVPDSAEAAPQVMAGLSPNGVSPTGSLMAWAYLQSEMAKAVSADPRADAARMASMGHSRFGKVSLISAAWSPHITASVAIQSGFGGAALSRSKTGETVARMLEGPALLGGLVRLDGYPHWLAPQAAEWADDPEILGVDQHMLLALIAPKPILLTNGRKDVWSDPNSTFRAALGATPIYHLYDRAGLQATTLLEFRPQDGIAFTLTDDGHGVRREDIDAIIAFLGFAFE